MRSRRAFMLGFCDGMFFVHAGATAASALLFGLIGQSLFFLACAGLWAWAWAIWNRTGGP